MRVFALQLAKHEILLGIRLPLGPCFLPGLGVAVSEQAILAERTGFPMRFVLDKGRDLKETVSGNTFVATLPGVHPVFGEALTIRVRGLQAESISEKDPQKAALAFDQGLRSGDPWMTRAGWNSETSSVGKEGFGFGRTFTWTVD